MLALFWLGYVSMFVLMAPKKTTKGRAKPGAKKAPNKDGDGGFKGHPSSRMITALRYAASKGKNPEKSQKAKEALDKYEKLKSGEKGRFAEMFLSEGGLASDMGWVNSFTHTEEEIDEETANFNEGWRTG